jgi:hypothetical protein
MPTEAETEAEAIARYHRALHAMQSGVAAGMDIQGQEAATTPKHLRTGVNAAMADHAGLVTLLIAKDVFTTAEYLSAIADSMEDEQRRYEERLSVALGRKVKLG